MSTPSFLLKTFILCTISFLVICIASCGVAANRQILPPGTGGGPAGGSSGGSGGGGASGSTPYNPPTSKLTAAYTAVDFSNTVEAIGSQQEDITFSTVNDSISDFSVNLDETAKNSGEWTLTESSDCASVLALSKKCIVSILFKPKQANTPSPASVTYSYTNNKPNGAQPPVTVQLTSATETFKSLWSTLKATNLNPSGLLATFISSKIIGSVFLGLTSDNSLNSFDISQTTPTRNTIATSVQYKHFNASSYTNTIFYTDMSASNYLTSTTSSQAKPINSNIVSLAADIKYTYGADVQGNIFSINADGSIPTQIETGINNYPDIITADLANTASSQTIYGVFSDTSTQTKHFICPITIALPSLSPNPNCVEDDADLANARAGEIIAYNGTVFVFTNSSGTIKITGFNNNLKTTFAPQTITATNQIYSPVYDEVNNMIYIVGSNTSSYYTLYRIDATNGHISSVPLNQSAPQIEAMSTAFITTNATTSAQKVLVVSSLGKIYAFNTDLTPVTFNGTSYYQLPISSTTKYYPSATALYNTKNTIFIPTSDSSSQTVQTNYLFPLNW